MSAAISGASRSEGALRMVSRVFPTPQFLKPPVVGVDISDTSIKWIVLEGGQDHLRVRSYGSVPLKKAIVERGLVVDPKALSDSLAKLREKLGGVYYVHAALPEETAYVFSMSVPPGTDRGQILRLVEFEFEGRVPIALSEAVYDFDVIADEGERGIEIAVSVFPRDVEQEYAAAFARAGFFLLSLEIEGCSIGRAISGDDADEPVTLLADIGRARTGFSVLKRGIPIFTSTVDIGGDAITRAVEEHLHLFGDDAERFKNREGLFASGDKAEKDLEALVGVASSLSDEVARHYHYWDTRRNEHGDRVSPVGRVVLVGGSSNLRGLPDYIAARIQAPVAYGNVWRHVCSFDDYIPPIDVLTAREYATAVGLALRAVQP